MKALKIPSQVDLTVFEFLQHGDRELIARKDREAGHKTNRRYVSEVIRGFHRNDRILKMAIDLALKRKAEFPSIIIKNTANAA